MVENALGTHHIVLEVELDEDHSDDASGPDPLLDVDHVFPFEGGTITVQEVDEGLGFDQTALVTLAVSFSTGVASGVVATALCALLGKAARRLSLQDRPVRVSEEDIARAVETILARQARDPNDTGSGAS